MESIEESDAGYPEEQPSGAGGQQDSAESPQREGGSPREGGEHGEGGSPATDNDDGKATGNPAS
jgi:hypothetical protein